MTVGRRGKKEYEAARRGSSSKLENNPGTDHALVAVLIDDRDAIGAPGRPRQESGQAQAATQGAFATVASEPKRVFRVNSQAVLLTYQSFPVELSAFQEVWQRFVSFCQVKVRELSVAQWTATAETNEDGKHHLHLMLKFSQRADQSLKFRWISCRCGGLQGDGPLEGGVFG